MCSGVCTSFSSSLPPSMACLCLEQGTPPCAGAGAAEAAFPLQVRAEAHALGGAHFGTIWRPTSSLPPSSLRWGVLPASCPTPGLAEQLLASPISSLRKIMGRKVTAVKIQKHVPPRGFAGTSLRATVANVLPRGGPPSKHL